MGFDVSSEAFEVSVDVAEPGNVALNAFPGLVFEVGFVVFKNDGIVNSDIDVHKGFTYQIVHFLHLKSILEILKHFRSYRLQISIKS